ncbi:hypothetical protein TRIP_C20566 [Candidatus Zixiibacteriota bacterium]|nr:hypothetical protein TRIP_C20566 [candidate division Zixibacteria bacterium]
MENLKGNRNFSALQYFPLELMRRHKIVPFGYDSDKRALRVACTSPNDEALANELSNNAGGIRIELYAANPDAIESVIGRLSVLRPDRIPAPVTATAEKIPSSMLSNTSTAESNRSRTSDEPANTKPKRGSILFVAPNEKLSRHLYSSLTSERYTIRSVESIDRALILADQESFDHIFVHETARHESERLSAWVRRHTPWTSFRFYSTEAAVLANDTTDELTFELFAKNLQLPGFLNNRADDQIDKHSRSVAELADRLCYKYDLPAHIRLAILTAAHLHNLAESTLPSAENYTPEEIIGLSAGRLTEWQYPPLVTRLLRCMYHDLANTPRNASDVERLGGSILTAADIYRHGWNNVSLQTREQLTEINKAMLKMSDKFALPEVIDNLIEILSSGLPASQKPSGTLFPVHVLVSCSALPGDLETALTNAGFSVTLSHSIDECGHLCSRHQPKVLIIRESGVTQDIYDLLLGLSTHGIDIGQIPTILLLDEGIVSEATKLIRHGVEDVLAVTSSSDALVTKLSRIKSRLEEKAHSRLSVLQELGTHGSLEDMGLVDLLEASRGNNRPVQISITGEGRHLTLYINQGKVVFAECDESRGLEAILNGISWKKGIWSIDPIDFAKMPEPNLNEGIDSVLLEACIRYDTAVKI